MKATTVFVDLETGGTEVSHPDIQIAAIAMRNWAELDSFEAKIIFDEREADSEALEINHYDPEVWEREAIPEQEVIGRFGNFLRKHAVIKKVSKRNGKPYRVARLAGHNAWRFTFYENEKTGKWLPLQKVKTVYVVDGDKARALHGCWEWTGPIYNGGYGRAYAGQRKSIGAHRLAWELSRGRIPKGLCVLHHCDNRPCVRPDHLFLGTRGDNARDMAAKGRAHLQRNPHAFAGDKHWTRKRPDRVLRGETHNRSRLTESQVIEIRERFAAGGISKAQLGRDYEVALGTVDWIIRGTTWAHVGGPVFPNGRRSSA